MLEPRGKLDLSPKTIGAKRSREFGVEHLEGDWALVPEIVGEKYRGHAPPPQLTFQPVAIAQAALEPLLKFHLNL
jgi:hypothetical protein